MAERIRHHPWASTPLGPPDNWPQPLRSAVSICLNSAFPTAIYWGPELRLLYNDAWAPIPGPRHPDALGEPARAVWSDIWHVLEPQFAHILATGEAVSVKDQHLPMRRYGFVEETYWYYSLSPIRNEDGDIAGVFNSGNETTEIVLAARRMQFLLELGDELRADDDPQATIATATAMLGRYLQVGRVGVAEIDPAGTHIVVEREWNDGRMPSFIGRHRLDAFGPSRMRALTAGKPLRTEDVGADPYVESDGVAGNLAAIDLQASIIVPVVRGGRLVGGMYVHSPERRRWTDAEVATVQQVTETTWNALERGRSRQELAESEARFRNLADSAPVIIWVNDGSGGFTYLSRRWHDYTGQEPEDGLGFGWLDRVHPEDAASVGARYRAAAQAAGTAFGAEFRLRRRDGSYGWVMDAARDRVGAGGEHAGCVGSLVDISERKEGEERQTLLMQEVDHRARNVLAVVQAVVRLSKAESAADFRNVVEGRIAALARAHNLLSASRWQGVEIRGLFEEELAPYLQAPHERVSFRGPPLVLPPEVAQTVALAAHELTTNAVKHGALSDSVGTVAVEWRLDAGDRLVLNWVETGQREIVPPQKPGFGSELLTRSIRSPLQGEIEMDWRPQGLACRIAIPLKMRASGAAMAALTSGRGPRLLIVEDEAVIALDLETRLTALGYQVIACVDSVARALALVESEHLDAALLDAQLRGESSIAVALALTRRNVPFAFTTGHSHILDLPDDLAEAPRLAKPVTEQEVDAVLRRLTSRNDP